MMSTSTLKAAVRHSTIYYVSGTGRQYEKSVNVAQCSGETKLSLPVDTQRHSAQTAPGHSTERDVTPAAGHTSATVDH